MKKFIYMFIVLLTQQSYTTMRTKGNDENPTDTKQSFLVSPQNNTIISNDRPVIVGIVKKQNGKPKKNLNLTLYCDGQQIAKIQTNNKGLFSYRIRQDMPLENGKHIIYAVDENNIYIRATMFIVDNNNRSLIYRSGNASETNSYIAYPFTGALSNTSTPYIVCVLLDSTNNPVANETITLTVDTTEVSNSSTSNIYGVCSYTLTEPQALTETSHTVYAHAQESDIDLTAQIFAIDLTAPDAPVITSPIENQTLTSNTVTITGTTISEASVTVFIDSNTYGEITYADTNGDWFLEIELNNGAHTVNAIATDLAFNESVLSSTTNFTVSA